MLKEIDWGGIQFYKIKIIKNQILHLLFEYHLLRFFLILCYIQFITTLQLSQMDNFKNDEAQLCQTKINHLLETIEEKRQPLESLTEISSNQYDEESQVSSCRQTDLADHKDAHLFNQPPKKPQTEEYNSKEIQNPHRIIMKGYLQKQTTNFLNRWQISYCVLTLSKLYFFEDDTRINLSSCINFAALKASIARKELMLTLRLEEYEEPICFRAYTQQQAQKWKDDIGSIIQYHINSSKVIFMEAKKYIYQEKDAITEKEFQQTAETGDILLMSTTDTQCAIQRFVTNSEFDHIGLVVRFNGQIKVFESNADEGVNIYSWPQFQNQFHQYQKIAVRKLHSHRKAELQPLLLKFIKTSIGKKYDLRALKLLRKTSEDDHEQQRGYFCSQLVAKVYKLFGLLEREKASSSYWPVDFTTRGGLNLLDAASLGEEKLIILNKHVKFCS